MRRSFQGRVAVLMMLWTGIIFTTFGATSWLLIQSQIITTSDHLLIRWATGIQSSIDPWRGVNAFVAAHSPSPYQWSTGELSVCITDSTGKVLHSNARSTWLADFARLDIPEEGPPFNEIEPGIDIQSNNVQSSLFTISHGEAQAPHRLLRLSTPEVVVLACLNMSEFEAGLIALKQYFFIGLLLGLVTVLVGAWLTAHHALHPLRRINRAAVAIQSSANFSDRIPATSRDYIEFAALVESLNNMMARLEKNFLRATRFTADASHELKTPIALLQNAVNTGLKTAAPGSDDEAHFVEIAGEISRLKKVSEALLLLSSADAGRLNMNQKRLHLSEELDSLCEDAGLLAGEQRIQFSCAIEKKLVIDADRVLLMQAVQNLVSNAIKYNRPGGRADLSCSKSGSMIILEVGNTGPAIPADHQAAIFERFHRVAQARADAPEGSGLGLNLAREIINAHKGTLELLSGEADAIRFRITIPATVGP